MKVTVLPENFAKGLDIIQSFSPLRAGKGTTSTESEKALLIRAVESGSLEICAFNGATRVKAFVPARVHQVGEFVVARHAARVIALSSEAVNLEVQRGKLVIGGTRLNAQDTSPEFLEVTTPDDITWFRIQDQLPLIKAVLPSVNRDDQNNNTPGVFICSDVIAGLNPTKCVSGAPVDIPLNQEYCVQYELASPLVSNAAVDIAFHEGNIYIRSDYYLVYASLVGDVVYPSQLGYIKQFLLGDQELVATAVEVQKAHIDRVCALTKILSDADDVLLLHVTSGGELVAMIYGGQSGKSLERIPIESKSGQGAFSVKLRAAYLSEVANSVSADTVTLRPILFSNPSSGIEFVTIAISHGGIHHNLIPMHLNKMDEELLKNAIEEQGQEER